MRRITGGVFQSLDGVMQAPGGPTEDPTGGFAHGGWSTGFWDDAIGQAMGRFFADPFDLLLGRKTYEIFAAHWPYVAEGDAMGARLNGVGKYVLTRGEDSLDWRNSHRLGDIEALVALKRSEGPDLIIQGSSSLYPQLLTAGLIDRLFLMTFPVVLGRGKRLFGEATPAFGLRLVDHLVSSRGVTMNTYEPAGAISIGSFQLPEPSARELARRRRMEAEG